MTITSFFGPAVRRLFPIPRRLKEATSTVPSKTEDLHERLAIVEKTSVTWQQLFTSLGVFAAIVFATAGVFYQSLIPNEISVGISNSTSLKDRFAEVSEQFKTLNAKFDKLQTSISSALNPKIVAAAIKDAASGDKASLVKTLPNARKLLTAAREMKVALSEKDFKEISEPLFSHYLSAKEPLKTELWLTFIELANTRTSADAILHPVSEAEIAEATANHNYFEGVEVDLSVKETWKDTIFKNCQIKISVPGNNLILSHVRFINDEFTSIAENDSSRKLLQSLLENDNPSVTARVAVFTVSPPVVKETNPVK